MSFGGSVSAMISSLKSNKQLLANRKTMKDIVKDNHCQSNGSLKYKELPETELKELKARIKAKLQFRVRLTIAIVLALTLLYVMYAYVIG